MRCRHVGNTNRTTAVKIALLALFAEVAGWSQIADWVTIFREMSSTDPAVSAAARKVSFDNLIPVLEAENRTAMDKDIAGISAAFREPELIRMQASGLLAGLAMRRADSAEVLRSALPLFLMLFDDANPRIRQNAVRSVISLKPQIPAEALPALIRTASDTDQALAAIAMFGVARFAETAPDAVQALKALFSPQKAISIRRAVVRAVGQAKVSQPDIVEEVRRALGENDSELTRNAVTALREIGPPAIGAAADLRQLLSTSTDAEMREAIKSALSHIEKH
jgi:hypothetical protein